MSGYSASTPTNASHRNCDSRLKGYAVKPMKCWLMAIESHGVRFIKDAGSKVAGGIQTGNFVCFERTVAAGVRVRFTNRLGWIKGRGWKHLPGTFIITACTVRHNTIG